VLVCCRSADCNGVCCIGVGSGLPL